MAIAVAAAVTFSLLALAVALSARQKIGRWIDVDGHRATCMAQWSTDVLRHHGLEKPYTPPAHEPGSGNCICNDCLAALGIQRRD